MFPPAISITAASARVCLCVCRVGKQLMAPVDLPERASPTGPTSRHVPPPADSAGTGSPRCSPDQGLTQRRPLHRRTRRRGEEPLFQQPRSRYFTINVKPLLFVSGNTRLRRHCRCCCHILICSPLWKTPLSINFTFMVATHNK